MTRSATASSTEADPIEEALGVVREARARAPRDFLLALSIALWLLSAALLGAAVLTGGGILQDLFVNLGAGMIATWVTVVLVDGLWKRRESEASVSLAAMSAQLEARRGTPLATGERDAWLAFIADYRALVRKESLLDRVRALPRYRRRLEDLEARGNRALAEFR